MTRMDGILVLFSNMQFLSASTYSQSSTNSTDHSSPAQSVFYFLQCSKSSSPVSQFVAWSPTLLKPHIPVSNDPAPIPLQSEPAFPHQTAVPILEFVPLSLHSAAPTLATYSLFPPTPP
eukprot:UN05202